MSSKRNDLGSCPYCGENLIETRHGWGCSNFKGGCKAFIFREDNFFKKVIGRNINRDEALTLIMGGTVYLEDIVFKGKERNIELTWGKNPEGSKYLFGYHMEIEGYEKED